MSLTEKDIEAIGALTESIDKLAKDTPRALYWIVLNNIQSRLESQNSAEYMDNHPWHYDMLEEETETPVRLLALVLRGLSSLHPIDTVMTRWDDENCPRGRWLFYAGQILHSIKRLRREASEHAQSSSDKD